MPTPLPDRLDPAIIVRELAPSDMPWAEGVLAKEFGSRFLTRKGELIDALGNGALVALWETSPPLKMGLLTFRITDTEAELVSIIATERGVGIGSALLGVFLELAGARTTWLVTTNDNLDALRFYQRRGFAIMSIATGAVDAARKSLKPDIPAVGNFGIPCRDELVLHYAGGDGGASDLQLRAAAASL